MWPSPSSIPINTSFKSSGIIIKALSAEDKRKIPLLERAAYKTKLADTQSIVNIKSC